MVAGWLYWVKTDSKRRYDDGKKSKVFVHIIRRIRLPKLWVCLFGYWLFGYGIERNIASFVFCRLLIAFH